LPETPGFGHGSPRRQLHQPRVIPKQTLVEHVLGLRVLVCQHVRGETPFAQADLSDLSAALEKFVETYELGDEVEAEGVVEATPEVPAAPTVVAPVPMAATAIEPEPELEAEPDIPVELPSALLPNARCFEIAPPPTSRVTLRAIEAAEQFVEWVRLADRCATFSSEEFRELYLEHCAAEDLVPLADNILRPALLRVEGVTKLCSDSGRKRRKRARHFLWRIDHAPSATVAVPWPELPLSTSRRVA
jgi:hypothetical protein